MDRARLLVLGLIIAAAGFGGIWWSQNYLGTRPGLMLEHAVLGIFNAEQGLPLEARAALFLEDSGLVVGVAGLVLAAVAFVLKGGKGQL